MITIFNKKKTHHTEVKILNSYFYLTHSPDIEFFKQCLGRTIKQITVTQSLLGKRFESKDS